jgi:para-nitrobenzyl esterase
MCKQWLIVGLAVIALPANCTAAAALALTTSGSISGVRADGLSVYKGVPFAAPPVGALRWRPPEPVPPWTGTRTATAFAPACMQEGVSMPGEVAPKVSEDCLYLNIWTPAERAAERLPVIVWIYGGGYRNGSASMPLYWGDQLAHRGVIVVTIAYRLGPLGFLALPELTRESSYGSSGNYGLMDQIAALRWVQHNISAFGGDSNRVTIAGQSSGAISVSILMASPQAKGLFQRAIGESGALFEPLQLAPSYLLVNAERDGEKYAAALGVHSLQELRRLPATRLLGGGNAGGVTHPVIEPYLLPMTPYAAFAAGRQNDVPVLIGSNAEEARSLTDVTNVRPPPSMPTLSAVSVHYRPRLLPPTPTRATKLREKHGSLLSAIFASAGTCGPGRGCRLPGKVLCITTRFDSGRHSRPIHCTRAGAQAILPNSGTYSII